MPLLHHDRDFAVIAGVEPNLIPIGVGKAVFAGNVHSESTLKVSHNILYSQELLYSLR
jgi:hypothetical protein